jgi:hypothetical protein
MSLFDVMNFQIPSTYSYNTVVLESHLTQLAPSSTAAGFKFNHRTPPWSMMATLSVIAPTLEAYNCGAC